MEEKYCQRKIQQQFGIEFCNEENSFVIFEAQLINSSSVVRLFVSITSINIRTDSRTSL